MSQAVINADANAGLAATRAAWQRYIDVSREPQRWSTFLEQAKDWLRDWSGFEHVCFSPGGTGADALALWAVSTWAQAFRAAKEDGQIYGVVSGIEHAAVRQTAQQLQSENHCVRTVSAGRDGFIAVDEIEKQAKGGRWISCLTASNETGAVQPIAELADWVRSQGGWMHTDAVPAIARLPNETWSNADVVSFSGHKFGAPKGSGVVLSRRPLPFAYAESAPLGTALVQALEYTSADWQPRCEKLTDCRDHFEAVLVQHLGEHIEILAQRGPRLGHVSNVRFKGCRADAMLMALDMQGVMVSTGSACSSGSVEPSEILLGMGLSREEALSCLRFSFEKALTSAVTFDLVERVVKVYGLAARL